MASTMSGSNQQHIKPGTRLEDRYAVEGVIGEGGFATVYNARDELIDRPVAIKVLSMSRVDDDDVERALQRFLREARLAARISHPSIVDIYDFGRLDSIGAPFIVMEFLDGDNLYNQIYGTGPLSPSWLVPNYCDILDALGEAHLENVVHKDLKPGNIYLHHPGTRREVWKLVDFGVAHIDTPSGARITQTGFLSGTPQYLPPEYIQKQEVSPQMDVYQMALTFIEALCGEPVVGDRKPFKAAMRHVEGNLEIPDELTRGTLGDVLGRALAPAPSDRFESALQFADALASVDIHSVPSFVEPDDDSSHETAKWAAIEKK